MRRLILSLAVAFALGAPGSAAAPSTVATAAQARSYEAGQVWEYRTRPEDPGSLIRIQRIEEKSEALSGGTIYHISLIGVRIGDGSRTTAVGHLPVARATLDASLTRLAPSGAPAEFPSADEGIEIWREAEGGVFDIPLDEIVAGLVAALANGPERQPADPVPTT